MTVKQENQQKLTTDIHDDSFLEERTVKSKRLILSTFATDIQTILLTLDTTKYTTDFNVIAMKFSIIQQCSTGQYTAADVVRLQKVANARTNLNINAVKNTACIQ